MKSQSLNKIVCVITTLAVMITVLIGFSVPVFADNDYLSAREARNGIVVVETYVENGIYYAVRSNGTLYQCGTLGDSWWTSGTGFFVGNPGDNAQYIVTNHHVVEAFLSTNKGDNRYIYTDQTTTQGETVILVFDKIELRIYYSEDDYEEAYVDCYGDKNDVDLAVLKISHPTDKRKTLPIGKVNDEMVGNTVYAIGYPGMADNSLTGASSKDIQDATVTKGTISRIAMNSGHGVERIATDAVINHGNSGGPLVDENGNVVGVNTNSWTENNISTFYAISSTTLTDFLYKNNIPFTEAVNIPNNVGTIVAIIVGGVVVVIGFVVVVIIISKKKKVKAAMGGFVSQQAVAGGFVPQQTVAGGSVPQQTVAGGFVPQQAVAGGSVPQQTVAGGSVPQQTVAGGSVPQQTVAGGFVPQQAVAGGSVPQQTVAGGSVPQQTVAGGFVPQQAAVGDSVPQQTVAGGSVPQQTVAGGSVPQQTVAGDSVPRQALMDGFVPQQAAGDYESVAKVQNVAPKKAFIRSMSPQHNGMIFPIGNVPVTIGKNASLCGIVFNDKTPGVSDQHCSVSYDYNTDLYTLTDLNSTYGTVLFDGQKLNPGQSIILKPGTGFYVGDKANMLKMEVE